MPRKKVAEEPKKSPAKKPSITKPAEAQEVKLTPVNMQVFSMTIEGISPLIQHSWNDKVKKILLEKKQGKKTKNRAPCDPEQEFRDATYVIKKGVYGMPVSALKSCLINAAHKDLGIEKTLVRKAVFIRCVNPDGLLPMQCSDPVMREDCVRLTGNSTDLRYRPEFKEWRVTMEIEHDADLLKPQEIMNLFTRAGFGVGLLEWRPEKGGEYGRFQVV